MPPPSPLAVLPSLAADRLDEVPHGQDVREADLYQPTSLLSADHGADAFTFPAFVLDPLTGDFVPDYSDLRLVQPLLEPTDLDQDLALAAMPDGFGQDIDWGLDDTW